MSGENVGHEEFQQKVLTGLTRLETKMDLLVGADGNAGKMAACEQRIDRLESVHDRVSGRHQGRLALYASILSAAVTGAVSYGVQKLLGH